MSINNPVNPCDVCGRLTAASDCVETLEEWLCWECASGVSEDDESDEEAFYIDKLRQGEDDG